MSEINLVCAQQQASKEAEEKQMATFQHLYQTMSATDLMVLTCWNELNNKIFILKCPNPMCETPFSDFDGCGALECTICSTHFCCLCFTTGTSQIVHAHVRNCDISPANGELFVANHFHAYHNKRPHKSTTM
jgi:hypothetical protein